MIPLKQSTAEEVRIGPFVDETDGKTAETALAISQSDIRLSKMGGDFAQINAAPNSADALVHDEKGYYILDLDDTDTDTLGHLRVHVHVSGALPCWVDFVVIPASVYDGLYGSGISELAADPGATPDPANALMLLYMAMRNKVDVTASTKEIHNNAGTKVLEKTVSNDGTTYSESKVS